MQVRHAHPGGGTRPAATAGDGSHSARMVSRCLALVALTVVGAHPWELPGPAGSAPGTWARGGAFSADVPRTAPRAVLGQVYSSKRD